LDLAGDGPVTSLQTEREQTVTYSDSRGAVTDSTNIRQDILSQPKVIRSSNLMVPTTLQNSFSLTFPDERSKFSRLISLRVIPIKQ